MKLQRLSKIIRGSVLALVALVVCAMPTVASAAAEQQTGQQQQMYKDAATEFKVPEQLLMALSYYQSRWEGHDGAMSVDGGYGPMNLRTPVPVSDERGDPSRPIASGKFTQPKGSGTISKAATLLGASPDAIKNDVRQNIRGGAAVLADQAKKLHNGQMPSDIGDWYGVVAAYLGDDNQQNVEALSTDIYNLMSKGQTATTTDNQQLHIQSLPSAAKPDLTKMQAQLDTIGLKMQRQNSDGAECPRTDNCRFIPAGYAANSDDPADYGNYDYANRPKDMKVNYIVIHDTEGSYTSAINHFQDTTSYVSAHYVIRSSDGAVTQMVPTSGVAWHAGDWYMNMHSIGIEHEGQAAKGASWYTEAMYRSSANLVRYLSKKYDIPMDRDHIIGHDNIPGLNDAKASTMHWDPGPYWDWDHYMDLINGKQSDTTADTKGAKNAVTIKPTMNKNVLSVNSCAYVVGDATCADHKEASNFVYLRTQPRADAPLITDALLHPGGQPGTTKIDDWSAKAATGQQYALADTNGDWTAIWFSGQKAWFYNPSANPTAVKKHTTLLKLKPGIASAHVYGGAYPEASVYPANVAGPVQPKLSYTIAQGQQYVSDGKVPTDYFYDATIDYSKPHDHEIFRGKDKYIKIWYNQRTMFVKASDFTVQ